MTIGNRISELRKAKGFTQEYVADQLGVTRQAVSKWEQDITSPDTKNLIALSSLLDASIEYIATGKHKESVRIDNEQIKSAVDEVKRWQNKRTIKTLTNLSWILPILSVTIWMLGVFTGIFWDFRCIWIGNHGIGIIFMPYGPSAIAIILEILYYLFLIAPIVFMFIANKLEGQD